MRPVFRIWGKRRVVYTEAVIVFAKCEAESISAKNESTSAKNEYQFFDAVGVTFIPCARDAANPTPQ
jgi:hypothetical protein